MAPLTRLDSVERSEPSSRSLHPGSRRSGALPASTSESALAHRTRHGKQVEPPPVPPPAQPKRVRPFILRAKNAPASSAKSPEANPVHGQATEGDGALRKSKTSFELERKTGSPSKPRKSPQPRDENAPPMPSSHRGLPTGQHGESEQLQAATGPPRRTSRPQSLATSSLRALGKLASSASSATGAPRRRPLSYVVSPASPPRSRTSLNPIRSPASSPTRTPRFRPRNSAAALAESPTSSRTSSQTATPVSSRVLPAQAPSHGGLQRKTQASPPHAIKTQSRHAAVEQHKSALKRKTLEERQARSSPASSSSSSSRSPAVVSAGALLDQAQRSAQPRAGLTRSRRWFGGDPSVPEAATSSDGLCEVEDRALTGQDAYATPPPSIRGSSAVAARKRATYASLGAANTGAGQQVFIDKDEQQRTGFASLQELLEQHGYAETRVITPHSTTQTARIRSAMADDVRADLLFAADEEDEVEVLASPLAGRTGAPSGPKDIPHMDAVTDSKELKERPSLLSLRGLFSFFGTAAVDVEEALASPELPPSPTRRADAQPAVSVGEAQAAAVAQPRMRTTSEMHRWVETVNEVYPPPVFALPSVPGSTATTSTAVMPELQFDHAVDEEDDDAASSRSYSSSISFSGSPPTPQPVFGEHDHAFVVSTSSSTHLSPPHYDGDLPRNKRLSLRHTVSDSNLLPSYQSFSGLGISAPSPPPPLVSRSQLAETRPMGPGLTAHRSRSPDGGAATAGTGTGLWGTSHLRARASQLFSLAMARSPVDAATGRSFLANATPLPTATPNPSSSVPSTSRSPFLPTSRAPPKLLRKAVSSAGLVSAPQVRRTRVVTKASWESFGSLEARVSLEERRRSLAGSSGDESDFDGGIGWGEDLLGRAWA